MSNAVLSILTVGVLAAGLAPATAHAASLKVEYRSSWPTQCVLIVQYYNGKKNKVTASAVFEDIDASSGNASSTLHYTEKVDNIGDSDSRVFLTIAGRDDNWASYTLQDCINAGGLQISKVSSSTSGADFAVTRWYSDGGSSNNACASDYFGGWRNKYNAYEYAFMGIEDQDGVVLRAFESKVAKSSQSGSSTQKIKSCTLD